MAEIHDGEVQRVVILFVCLFGGEAGVGVFLIGKSDLRTSKRNSSQGKKKEEEERKKEKTQNLFT